MKGFPSRPSGRTYSLHSGSFFFLLILKCDFCSLTMKMKMQKKMLGTTSFHLFACLLWSYVFIIWQNNGRTTIGACYTIVVKNALLYIKARVSIFTISSWLWCKNHHHCNLRGHSFYCSLQYYFCITVVPVIWPFHSSLLRIGFCQIVRSRPFDIEIGKLRISYTRLQKLLNSGTIVSFICLFYFKNLSDFTTCNND